MTPVKIDSTYYAFWTCVLGYCDQHNKPARHKTSLRTSVKKDAQARCDELDRRLALERARNALGIAPPVKSDMLLSEYLAAYEDATAEDKTESTRNVQKYMFAGLLKALGDRPLKSLSQDVLEAYRKTRLKEVAPATWNSELGHFKAAFAWGLTRNPPVFDKNPWSAVKSVTKPKATIQKYVAPDQIEASQAQGDPFWINTLEFLRVTWCRGGELRRLQWKHVYWSAGHLDFVGPKEKEPKRIPLNIQVANVLNVAKQLRPPASLDSYVFPNRTGGKLSKSTLYYGIRGLGAKALVKLSPHMLRHSGITNALDRGANLYAVQNVAGHSQVTTTQRYVHTDMKAKRQAMETLDATQDKAGPRYISDDPATGDATTGS